MILMHRSRRRGIRIGRALLFLSFFLSATASFADSRGHSPGGAESRKLEKVALQLKWRHQFQFAGYYMAKEKGYYRDAGLDVEIREADPSTQFTDEVVSGRAQYGVNNTDLLIDRIRRGKKVVVLSVLFQHSPNVLLSLAKSGLQSPKDFVGRRVMISADAEAEILSMFSSESIPRGRIDFIPHSWNLDDLVAGRVDAISAYSTNESITLASRGIACSTIKPITYGIDFYGDCLFTSEAELKAHTERAAAFLAASLKGWDYALDHVDEACDLILAKYSTEKPKEALLAEAKAMDDLIVHKLVPVGFMNPGRWRRIADTYAALGSLPRNYKLDGFLFDPASPTMDPRILELIVALLSAAIAAALLYILILRAFNSRLSALVKARTAVLEELNRALSDEVRERKEKERIIAESLAEKEVLLKEVHHRVKNNLQVVASLVNLQLADVDDPKVASLLVIVKNRILSIALVHEQLYSRESLSSIDMEDYLRYLVDEIVHSYQWPGLSVVATVEAAGVALPIDQASPLGLIVGELVTNSMKYAFEGRTDGRILVELREEEGRYQLRISDDGPGKDPSAPKRSGSGVGLQLVEALSAQLGGVLRKSLGAGCCVSVSFPALSPKKS
jgi:two-component sensor histidine kinase/ABC-type nitrate/sulfonate/bicarbonate transport system substrate-binding protein